MSDCCDSVFSIAVPGPAGAPGAAGADGTNGSSAFTTAVGGETMPYPVQRFVGTLTIGLPTIAYADTSTLVAGMSITGTGIPTGSTILSVDSGVQITITNNATVSGAEDTVFTQSVLVATTSTTQFMVVGEVIIIYSWGEMIVTALNSDTTFTVYNPRDDSLGYYPNNSNQGTLLSAGKYIVPGGRQGPAGATNASAFQIANNLSEGNAALMRGSLMLGTVSTFTQGNADNNIPRVNLGGGLVNGQAVVATALGLATQAAATFRATINAQALDAFLTSIALLGTAADKMIYTTGVDVAAETALTAYMRTLLAAVDAPTARGLLGVSAGATLDYMLYRQESVSGVDGVACVAGLPWKTAPMNTEVVDQGNHGSITSNTVTLAAGTYRYRFSGTTSNCQLFQARLFNVTTAVPVTSGYGQAAGAAVAVVGNDQSVGSGVFTIAVSNDFRIEIFCSSTGTFGAASNTGGPEIYTTLEFWKE